MPGTNQKTRRTCARASWTAASWTFSFARETASRSAAACRRALASSALRRCTSIFARGDVDALDLGPEDAADALRLAIRLDPADDGVRRAGDDRDQEHRERDPEGHARTLTGRVEAERSARMDAATRGGAVR